MSRVLVIGCGGVASVAIQKCCHLQSALYDRAAWTDQSAYAKGNRPT